MKKTRFAQYGTKHFHAEGKYRALQSNSNIEVAGVYEPDASRRSELEQSDGPFAGATFYHRKEELLGDSSIVAVASEGMYDEHIDQTEEIIRSGKHVWHDKPAGTDLEQWRRILDMASDNDLHVQVGYMLRFHNGVRLIDELIESGVLGDLFAIRVNMSTNIPERLCDMLKGFPGGTFFDLAPHMLDLIIRFLGRPEKITSFLRNDGNLVEGFKDNTVAVLEYQKAMATVSIAAMEANASQRRRFEVQGSNGNATMQPLETTDVLILNIKEPRQGYGEGAHELSFDKQSRQALYDLELASFLEIIQKKKAPDCSIEHEFLVQETLLRSVNEEMS